MSNNEDTSIYKRIELLQAYILGECEAYIYNPQDRNYKIFLRIKHIVFRADTDTSTAYLRLLLQTLYPSSVKSRNR